MEIYKMLKENSDMILKEDLEFFEIELATGDYQRDYIDKCLKLIKEIRDFRNIKVTKTEKIDINGPTVIKYEENEKLFNVDALNNEKNKEQTEEQKTEKIKTLINNARISNSYQIDFKKIINDYNVQEEFVDKNYVFFKQIEIDVLIQMLQFSEDFLEKYFKLLNHNLLAEYQLFSETFYMKHFSQLDYKIVLKKGKNPWVKKDQRSSKLTVFLKLKGITL